jgi:hypothetical protein
MERIHQFPSNQSDFPKLAPAQDIFFGSFHRGTKILPLDDVDVMACLHADGAVYNELLGKIEISVPPSSYLLNCYLDAYSGYLNSKRIINKFVAALKSVGSYRKAEIHRNGEAATVEFSSYPWAFDVVPCFFTKPEADGQTFYIIPDGQGAWMKTDPRIDRDAAKAANNKHGGKALEIVRLVKYWNRRPTAPSIPSYVLETMVLTLLLSNTNLSFQNPDLGFAYTLDYIKSAIMMPIQDLKWIQGDLNKLPFLERVKVSTRAAKDLEKASIALSEERRGNYASSLTQWTAVFGNEFDDTIEALLK